MAHTTHESQEIPREIGILNEIREAEKKADEILGAARREKESMLQEARVSAAKLLSSKEEEIRDAQEKKLMDFREKSKLIIDEKIAEGKSSAKQVKSKAEKSISKAVDFVMNKIEEMI